MQYDRDSEEEVIRKVEEWRKENPKIKFDLTEQQKTAVGGRIAEGYLWVGKDKAFQGVVFFKNKPQPSEIIKDAFKFNSFTEYTVSSNELYDFVTFKNSPIYLPSLVKEEE